MKKFLPIIFIFFSYTAIVHAADVSIVVPKNIESNQQFPVTINLNTDGILVNSFDISITYPKEIISFDGYKEEGSIKKSWLITPKDESGTIHFIGIIPNGVSGIYDPDKKELQSIPIINLLFSPVNEGQGVFNITHSDVLQNDGSGTPLLHEKGSTSITVLGTALSSKGGTTESVKEKNDKEPPEPFNIEYLEASFFSRTPSMIIFSTVDIGSGVEKYQLKTNSFWKDVMSPLSAPKSLLRRTMTIRAVDFSGNIRESNVEIPGLVSGNQLISIIFMGMVCYFIFFVVKRRR